MLKVSVLLVDLAPQFQYILITLSEKPFTKTKTNKQKKQQQKKNPQ